MEVLMLLAEHGDRVVSREELLKAVWASVVVGDEALTQSIIKLRRALGDDPRAPSYIETIPKRGYRLIAPVAKSDDVDSHPRRCGGRSPTIAAGRWAPEPFARLDSRRRVRLDRGWSVRFRTVADFCSAGRWCRRLRCRRRA